MRFTEPEFRMLGRDEPITECFRLCLLIRDSGDFHCGTPPIWIVWMPGMSYKDSCTPVMTRQLGRSWATGTFGMPLGCGGGTGLGLFLRILDSSFVCPDKWIQTKIPCRFNSLHGICWRMVRPIRTEGKAALNLAKTAKKGYTYPSGADLIRCVGGCVTCAGTGERQLPCTAVIFVFLTILYYRTNVPSIIM